ncbi:MAG TPA: DUF58 domain-containing protein [Trueperaceae bacterium]|nr:DUF58 domain-containing protein [Trueperaceae bacterium]
MLTARSRALLDRYSLASRALSAVSGERASREPGQGVEFHDFRPYQPGDELRYVDWRVYARTGRLYTRLYQAERSVRLHLVVDDSESMGVGGKRAYARVLAQLISYVAQRDAPTQVHRVSGGSSRPLQGRATVAATWSFIDEATGARGSGPVSGLKTFALSLQPQRGSGLALVISDLFEDVPLRPALSALKARGLDAAFLQVVASEDLDPPRGELEVVDVETGERRPAGPDEVEAYRREVRRFLERTREAVLRAGFRHLLLVAPPAAATGEAVALEKDAFADLLRAGVLVKR